MTLVLAQSVISLLLSVQPIKIFNIYPLVVLLSFVLMYVQKINIAIFICGLHYLSLSYLHFILVHACDSLYEPI